MLNNMIINNQWFSEKNQRRNQKLPETNENRNIYKIQRMEQK